jgi:hypothetical protein
MRPRVSPLPENTTVDPFYSFRGGMSQFFPFLILFLAFPVLLFSVFFIVCLLVGWLVGAGIFPWCTLAT